MVFPVVMYGCEHWTTVKAEHCRQNWCFQTVVLEMILESPLDSKEIKAVNPVLCWVTSVMFNFSLGKNTGMGCHTLLQGIFPTQVSCTAGRFFTIWATREVQSSLKEINSEDSLEGLMLKLKLQYFGHLMRKANSLEKTLMLGKTEGKRRRGWQRMRWLDGITNSIDMSLSKIPGDSERQGSLVCCNPQGCKELDTTVWVNNNRPPLRRQHSEGELNLLIKHFIAQSEPGPQRNWPPASQHLVSSKSNGQNHDRAEKRLL